MTETCARCGRPDPGRKLYPPLEWVEYLQVEREMPPPEGDLAVPLCTACHDRLAVLNTAFEDLDRFDEDRREATRDRITAALDDLDLAALVDEDDPHDGSRSLL